MYKAYYDPGTDGLETCPPVFDAPNQVGADGFMILAIRSIHYRHIVS